MPSVTKRKYLIKANTFPLWLLGWGGGGYGKSTHSTNTLPDAQRYTFMYILAHMVRGEKDSQVLKDEIFLAGLECVDQLKDVWVV